MSMRAQAVAEILYELKQADKIATLSSIAKRAGFSPGASGQTIRGCLKAVRRDWSHLQWWRAIADNGQVDEEQLTCLVSAGFEIDSLDNDTVVIKSLAEHSMNWGEVDDSQDGTVPSAARRG
jgi:alkylated DNA nucleotide flippase Atl1